MAMTVDLGDMKPVVEGLVSNGRYTSSNEVLKDAVRLLQARDARLAKLYAELDEACAQADAGLVTPLEDVEAEILAELRALDVAA